MRPPHRHRFRVVAALSTLGVLAATAACGNGAEEIAGQLASVKASASASALAAEHEWMAMEAEGSAQAAAESAASASTSPTTPAPPESAVDPDLLDPAVSPGAAGLVSRGSAASQPSGESAAIRPERTVSSALTSVTALEARVGPIGVAVVPVGGGSLTSYGSITTGVAWSTIKVPLSVAAVRADGGRPSSATAGLIQRAITVSDNAAAERLWGRLGGGGRASAAVGAVLAEGGDTRTTVPTRRQRAGFTVFGQTQWPLARAASYAAHLPCQRGAGAVLTRMGQITAGHRWGLGVLGGSMRFKGGWGPEPGGGYLVRQIGVMSLPRGGQVGVALASRPASGSFEDGKTALTALARWLAGQAGSLTGGRC